MRTMKILWAVLLMSSGLSIQPAVADPFDGALFSACRIGVLAGTKAGKTSASFVKLDPRSLCRLTRGMGGGS